jgi:hypothetical protein
MNSHQTPQQRTQELKFKLKCLEMLHGSIQRSKEEECISELSMNLLMREWDKKERKKERKENK